MRRFRGVGSWRQTVSLECEVRRDLSVQRQSRSDTGRRSKSVVKSCGCDAAVMTRRRPTGMMCGVGVAGEFCAAIAVDHDLNPDTPGKSLPCPPTWTVTMDDGTTWTNLDDGVPWAQPEPGTNPSSQDGVLMRWFPSCFRRWLFGRRSGFSGGSQHRISRLSGPPTGGGTSDRRVVVDDSPIGFSEVLGDEQDEQSEEVAGSYYSA